MWRRLSTSSICFHPDDQHQPLTDLDPLENLEHEVAVVYVIEGLVGLVDHVVEVAVQKLHDDVELVVLLVDQQILQGDDVRVRLEIPGWGMAMF